LQLLSQRKQAVMLRSWIDVGEFVAPSQLSVPPGRAEIFASAQLKAEIPRVLHALAVPEYMEAWMQLPGMERIECRSDPRSFDRFRIDLITAGQRRGTIHGSCLLTKPNRITYLWENSLREALRSVVEIRLWAYPMRCTLNLKHNGLTTPEDKDWYSRMWRDSLHKLCALMEGTGVRPMKDLH
jgi:uncharacterized protein YndB with AHSA1/START domain